MIHGEAFDCRVLLNGATLEPGSSGVFDVVLLNWHLARQHFSVAAEFEIWEGRPIGRGVVQELYDVQ